MDYQALDADKNELRLLYFIQDRDTLTSTSTNEHPQGIVQLEMRTISLDDFTAESREFMESKGDITYSFKDYIAQRMPALKPFHSDADRAAGMQLIDSSADDTLNKPSFGRWSWGDYMTLSYTWGDTSITRTIIVNGHPMEVTENLEDFLRGYIMSGIAELSVEEERLGIWIDAVCINQNDVEERNVQVKRMRDIYKQAAGAIVWLGKAADDSDKAMDLLDSVAKHQFNTREKVATYMASIRENPNVFAPGSWKALHHFLSRPYWTRLWVIQEIALSYDSLNVVCGNREINWPFLYGAISAFSIDIEAVISAAKLEYNAIGSEAAGEFIIMDGMNRIQHLGLFRDAEAAGLGRPDLKHLLAISRGAKQKDPKDKVYGILSLVDPSLSDLITPDYGASTSEVFIDFAKAAITSTGSLDIITNHGKSYSSERTLPSWVPDWTEEPAVRIEMTMKVPYQASRDSMVIKFENEYLLARGFKIDKVDGLGVDFWADEEVEDIIQPVHMENPYGDNASIRDALWRTLVANRDAAGEVAPDSYKGLLEVPWIDEDADEYSPSGSEFLDNFHMMRLFNGELQLGGRNFKSYFPPETDNDSLMPTWTGSLDPLHRVYSVVCGRKLIITAKGYFGLAAKAALQDDIICILLGCTVPVILRPSADGSSYRVVGESYIHGFMDGEAMDGLKAGQYSLEDFTIS